MQLFAHPFSSYCQKVLIALYENATPFAYRMLSPDEPETGAEFARLQTAETKLGAENASLRKTNEVRPWSYAKVIGGAMLAGVVVGALGLWALR